jgi:chromosome segregation ATPase
MKNQSFHQRKIRIQETPNLDFDQLKARTINALHKLGQQTFSPEPGGYALENWIRGVNVLLDEFEEKAGAARISPEYLASRHNLNDRLSEPIPTSSIDEDISKLRSDMSHIEEKIEAERAPMVSRISELKAMQAECSRDLERERKRVADAPVEQNNNSLFTRLFAKNRTTKNQENKIPELESKLSTLTSEALEHQKQLKMIDLHLPESRLAEAWKQLESMQTRLDELEKERVERTQLVKERAEATGSIADAIARIP